MLHHENKEIIWAFIRILGDINVTDTYSCTVQIPRALSTNTARARDKYGTRSAPILHRNRIHIHRGKIIEKPYKNPCNRIAFHVQFTVTIIVKTHANICCFQFYAIHKKSYFVLFGVFFFQFDRISQRKAIVLYFIQFINWTILYVDIFIYYMRQLNGTTNKQINRLLCAQYNLSSLTCRTKYKIHYTLFIGGKFPFCNDTKKSIRVFYFRSQCSSGIVADVDVGSVVHNQSVSS